ncbi:purine and uridine phosphorylase, partial [Aureobasidium melanogenum]
MSDPQHYTVGWICAITTEFTAARQFLDEEHGCPDHVSTNDSNSYTLGKMAGHNVVIAVLPRGTYGLSPAASVAANMLSSFPNIRVGLMVGIGGGAPTAMNDIRLGDVVYDYGKTIQDRKFKQTGFLNKPPEVVLTAVSALESTYQSDGHNIEHSINAALEKKPRLKKNYGRPVQETDCLYKSTIVHPYDSEGNSEGDCRQLCGGQPHDIVQRRKRGEHEDDPAIHYGIVASANQLMKDATVRDRLANEKGVLCFEMEAAGLMNHFPCLVIRGICDYADSHKNKEWQGYAAMTAAAYAKDLLARMVSRHVEKEERLGKVLSEKNEELRDQNEEHRKCHQVFKTSTYEHFKDINPEPAEETCQWALDHPLYQRWTESTTDDLLWISADPGCGKSVLSKSLVDERLMSDAFGSTICYFFFKDNDEQNSLATCLCALLHQLFQHQPHLLRHAVPAWGIDGNKLQQETGKLWHILLAATSDAAAHNTICVLDALDECKDGDRSNLIDKLARFYKNAADSQPPRQSWLKFIVTSRPYDDIQIGFQDIPTSLPAIRLRGEEENDQICTEINRVINLKVRQLANRLGLRESTSSRLEQTLLAMEHRTYLWLHLAIDDIRTTLQDSFTPDEEPIESVPSSVEGAYEKILSRVPEARRQKVKLILRIIVGARRPLAVGEMALALGLATSKQHRTSADVQINAIHLENQLRHWCGLFIFVNRSDSRIYLIHQTAREFLIAREYMPILGHLPDSLWRYSLEQIETEKIMAEICIRCLNLEDLKMLLDDDHLDESNQSQRCREEFAEYCCEWWVTHYRCSESATEKDTFQGALELYDTGGDDYWTWATHREKNFPIDITSMTRMGHAAYNGHGRILEHILSVESADVNEKDFWGMTALFLASTRGHNNTFQMLLDRGADINQGGRFGTPLEAASGEGHDDIVQMLLDKGADVNAQGGEYGSALLLASAGGHDDIVRMLLNNGADVNAQGGAYGSALQAASANGHDNIVRMLLNKGANANAQNTSGYGQPLLAASVEGHDNIVRMLLNKGADIDDRSGDHEWTALQGASVQGHESIVQMLLEKGADINSQDVSGQFKTAVREALIKGHDKIMQMLLDKGTDVNAQDKYYGNALLVASSMGHDKIVQILLDKGADVNAQDEHGTALEAASSGGHDKIVQMLLDKGADIGQYDTAIQAAHRKGYDDIVQMLHDARRHTTV